MVEPLPRYPMPTHRWGPYRARVVRVIDGDTVRVECDLGFHVYRWIDVRLMNVNAPEIRGPEKAEGEKAKAWAEIWCSELRADWPLLVATYKESFTRYVGVIWRIEDGRCINEEITKSGLAQWAGA